MGQYTGTSDPPADAESNLRVAATNLIRIAPDLAESKLASALLKYRDGHLEGALADAHQATRMRLASKAGAGLAHAAYGWYLMNAGRTDDALRELLLAEQATHADPIILYQLGNVYFVKHQFPQALERFQNAIDLEPRQYWGYFGMGCVFEETGQFEKAINQFELGDRAVGRKEAQTKDFYNELHAAIKRDPIQGYWEERLKQLLSNSPEHDHAIAIVLAHLRRTDEAYDRLKRASDKGRLEGLWFDPCWDHKDERFKLIAKKVSMKP
jgi:tetratricopeptide (TPR) repeat protein